MVDLLTGVLFTDCHAVVLGSTPIALFGCSRHPGISDIGVVWMLASPELKKIRLQFLRQCRWHIDQFFKTYSVLWNRVDARNAVHIRWIKWCGFTVFKELPEYGPEKRLFYEFIKAKD